MTVTIESIKANYPDPITADANEGLVRRWLEELPADKKTVTQWDDERHSHINTYIQDDVPVQYHSVIETDELYPQCNYCIGGALQMAFGETESSLIDDWQKGVFPNSEDLANTLHYFCGIPYGKDNLQYHCRYCPYANSSLFPQHDGQDCFTQSSETAYALADKITRANDRGEFDYAWSYVEFVLKLGRKNEEISQLLGGSK